MEVVDLKVEDHVASASGYAMGCCVELSLTCDIQWRASLCTVQLSARPFDP